jgi:hypothetical protein
MYTTVNHAFFDCVSYFDTFAFDFSSAFSGFIAIACLQFQNIMSTT